MHDVTTSLGLADYVAAVRDIVASARGADEAVAAIAPLKRRLLLRGDELCPETFFEGLDKLPYTRNLLHADPEGRFTVMAVVWGAGKESPIHDHETWGVVGVLRECIEVVDYECAGEGAPPSPRTIFTCRVGDVLEIRPPRLRNIHKMGNRGDRPCLTLHTYGDPARLCRVYSPRNGACADRPLSFHHAL